MVNKDFPCKNSENQVFESKLKYGKTPSNEKVSGAQEKASGAQPGDARLRRAWRTCFERGFPRFRAISRGCDEGHQQEMG